MTLRKTIRQSISLWMLWLSIPLKCFADASVTLDITVDENQAILIESARGRFSFTLPNGDSVSSYYIGVDQIVLLPGNIDTPSLTLQISAEAPLDEVNDLSIHHVEINEQTLPALDVLASLNKASLSERETEAYISSFRQRAQSASHSGELNCSLEAAYIGLLLDADKIKETIQQAELALAQEYENYCPNIQVVSLHTLFNVYRFKAAHDVAVSLLSKEFTDAIKSKVSVADWPEWQTNYPHLSLTAENDYRSELLSDRYSTLIPNLLMQLGFTNVLTGSMDSNRTLMEIGKFSLDQAHSKILEAGYTELLPDLYNGFATYWSLTGDNEASSRFLEMAIEVKRDLGLPNETGDFLNNLALVHLWSGNLADAQQTMRRAILLAEYSANHFALATNTVNLARTYRIVGDSATSRRYYEKGLELFGQQGGVQDTVEVHIALSQVDLQENVPDSALVRLKIAKSNAESNRPEKLALVNSLLALTHSRLGQYSETQQAITSGIAQVEEILKDSDKANFWLNIANAQFQIGDAVQSLESLNLARQYVAPDHPSIVAQQTLAYRIAMSESEEDSEVLSNIFAEARNLVFQIESTLDFHRMGPNWLSHVRQLYDLHVTNLIAQGDLDSLSRSLTLMDEYQGAIFARKRHFYENQENIRATELDPIWEQKLDAELALVNASTPEAKEVQADLLDAIDEKWQLATTVEIKGEKGELFQPLPSLNEVQEKLAPNQAILRYIALPTGCNVVLITNSLIRIESVQCPPDKATIDGKSGRAIDKRYRNLSADSFLPIARLNQLNIDELIIVLDATFQSLPFPLLRLDNSEYQYIGTQYKITRLQSLASFGHAQTARKNLPEHTVAVFDSPRFTPENDERTETQKLGEWSGNLKNLRWSKEEGDAIDNAFTPLAMLRQSGDDATTEALMSEPFRDAKILHIATHGYFDPAQPDVVGLATSYRTGDSGLEPGFVSQNYLLSKPFNNQMVVLSGCETALGRHMKSDGYQSLAYGVLSAGADSTMSTHWKVADRPTALFMEHFYRALADSGNSAEAMLAARRAMVATPRYRYPEYWAAFNLQFNDYQAQFFEF